MTRDELVARIKEQLGFRTDKDAEIVEAIKIAQQQLEMEPELPEFLITERASINLTAGEERIQLPEDFLLEVEKSALWITDTDGIEHQLVKDDMDFLRGKFAGSAQALPEYYAIDSLYFRMFPTPDQVYTITMSYYAADTVLSSNVENKWLKNYPLLVGGIAGQIIAGALRDREAFATFQLWEQRERGSMLRRSTAKDFANMRVQMGGRI